MPVDIKSASEADWSGPGADVRARQAVAQMLTDMDLDRSSPLQVAREATLEALQARGLGPMLRVLYRNHPYLAVTDCRPELASWRHRPVLDDYWRGHEGIERARAATAKMLDELGLAEVSRRDPSITLARLTLPVVTWCGLDNMIQVVYSGSVRAALRAILPGIPPWRHSRSPKGHWQGIEGVERAQETTRTLIGEYGWAGLPAEEVAERVSRKMFLDHGLAGMLDAVYERRAYDALADIYPGLQPWQMGTAPHGYWSRSDRRANGRAATRWLIRRSGLRGAPLAEVATRLNREAYEANGLSGMLSCVYDNSPYSALQDVYPDLRPWLVDIPAPNRYWVGVEGRWHAREALHWMLAQLGLQKAPPLEVAGVIDQALFARMGLGGMLAIVYGNSPYAALSDVFPTLRPWQMRGNTPMRYWQGEGGRVHARQATLWMLEQYGLEYEEPTELAEIIEESMFTKHGLYGMLSIVYNGSPYAALADLFPQMPPYEPRVYLPKGYWHGEEGRERARQATRDMLAALGLADAQPTAVAAAVDKKVFIGHGLGSALRFVYGTSPYHALVDLYPELRPWQMGGTPQGCWQGEAGQRNGREATLDMLARLGLRDADVADVARIVDAGVFEQNGLGHMLAQVYGGSPYEALKEIYPDLRPWQMSRTPREYWSGADAAVHGREATLWLLSKLSIEARPGNNELRTVTKAKFRDNGLAGMLAALYRNSPNQALLDAIPGLRPWQVRSVPRDYWRGEGGRLRARDATRWLLAQRGIDASTADPATVTGNVDHAAFGSAGLGGMIAGVYSGSVYAALADVVPGLVPWQTGTQVPLNYWRGHEGRENARDAIRRMLGELGVHGASPTRIAEAATQAAFVRFGLGGMLSTVYNSSRYAALSDVVPELRPWQMGVCVPQGYWLGGDARSRAQVALRWLLDQAGAHEPNSAHAAQVFTKELFRRYGLGGMLQEVYGGSLYWAFADLYPDVGAWQVGLPTPKNYWKGAEGRERARRATRWALAQLAGHGEEPDSPAALNVAATRITGADFGRLGLGGMLNCVYGDSARRALADVMPNVHID